MTEPTRLDHRGTSEGTRIMRLFVAASLSAVVLYRRWPTSHLWVPVALVGISVAIWHGAYDAVLAETLWEPRYPGEWLLPFVSSYVGLAALVVVAWWIVPEAALIAFLLYSGLHFGMEAEPERSPARLIGAAAFGLLPIAAACHWQAGAVSSIFATMLRGRVDAAESVTSVAALLLLPCILLSFITIVRSPLDAMRRVVTLAAQLLLFRFCPPVLAFAVFFCALHTPEHLVETSRTAAGSFSANRMWQNLRQGIVPWLISLAAVAIALIVGRHTAQAYTGEVFILLSALTVPHMVLGMLSTSTTQRKHNRPFQSAQRMAHS